MADNPNEKPNPAGSVAHGGDGADTEGGVQFSLELSPDRWIALVPVSILLWRLPEILAVFFK